MIPGDGGRHITVPEKEIVATVVLVHDGVEVASWPLVSTLRPDLSVVDEVARLQLAAGRLGCAIRLRAVRTDMFDLLAFAGLREVVPAVTPAGDDGSLQAGGEPEGPEQRGVQEVVVPDDPVA